MHSRVCSPLYQPRKSTSNFPKDEDIYTGFILNDFIFEVSDINFQVMVQRHNRHMSFSLYISALAVTDTVVLICGEYFMAFNQKKFQKLFRPFPLSKVHYEGEGLDKGER